MVKVPICTKGPIQVLLKCGIVELDGCIAKIVEALDKGGIQTRYSCCGHGFSFGFIILQNDYTLLLVKERDKVIDISQANRNDVSQCKYGSWKELIG